MSWMRATGHLISSYKRWTRLFHVPMIVSRRILCLWATLILPLIRIVVLLGCLRLAAFYSNFGAGEMTTFSPKVVLATLEEERASSWWLGICMGQPRVLEDNFLGMLTWHSSQSVDHSQVFIIISSSPHPLDICLN